MNADELSPAAAVFYVTGGRCRLPGKVLTFETTRMIELMEYLLFVILGSIFHLLLWVTLNG